VVGVSNVLAGSADLVTVWSDLIVVAARTYPGLDLVGYELGADLQAALAAGFAGIGPLRVWMRRTTERPIFPLTDPRSRAAMAGGPSSSYVLSRSE
jgi:hypothetical protein